MKYMNQIGLFLVGTDKVEKRFVQRLNSSFFNVVTEYRRNVMRI